MTTHPRPSSGLWTKAVTTMADGASLWISQHNDPSSVPSGRCNPCLDGEHSQDEVSDWLIRRAFPELASDKS